MVHITSSKPLRGYTPQPNDIIFIHSKASCVHHLHEDALVITIEVANNLIYRLLVDSESTINILYWDTY